MSRILWLGGFCGAFATVAQTSAVCAEARVYYCKASGANYIVTVDTVTRVVKLNEHWLDEVSELSSHKVDAWRSSGEDGLGFHVLLEHTSPKTSDFELTMWTRNSRNSRGYVGRCNFERTSPATH